MAHVNWPCTKCGKLTTGYGATLCPGCRRTGNWIQTHSGRAYYPTDPHMDDIFIDDIAHALSMQCRFVGHCSRFYSIAEHSVHVSRLVPAEHALAGLLHDAHEAYVHDISRPLKAHMPEYKAIEQLNWFVLAAKFGVPFDLPECVKEADSAMVFVERRALFPPSEVGARPDWGHGLKEPEVYPDLGVIGWPQAHAKQQFYDRYFALTSGAAI